MRRLSAVLGAAAIFSLLQPTTDLPAQQKVSPPEGFEGHESWPLYEPGDLDLDFGPLTTQRTEFAFRVPSGDTIPLLIDVFESAFQGGPAYWVQWTSGGLPAEAGGGTGSIDAILVHGETFRVLWRVAAIPGDRTWAGSYEVSQHHPEEIVRVQIAGDGEVATERVEMENDPFDFATMGYLFPFIGLEAGKRYRLRNIGVRGDPAPRDVSVRVAGRTTVTGADGERHEVWEVQLLPFSRRNLVTFWVDDEAPYFYGWSFRNVESGRLFSELRYRGHTVF